MKHLGIDYGTKKVGVAVSDESGVIATPLDVLPNDDHLIQTLTQLCAEHKVERIVMGSSTTYKGDDNPVMTEARRVKKVLEGRLSCPVEFEPEFLTTAHAARTPENLSSLDASAAALILQSYLDRCS